MWGRGTTSFRNLAWAGVGATHKGWCLSVCSLFQYFCRNFSALSAASTEPGWLATARFTTCQGQGGQWCLGQPQAHGWQPLGTSPAMWKQGRHCPDPKLIFMSSDMISRAHRPPAPIWPRGQAILDHLQSLCGQSGTLTLRTDPMGFRGSMEKDVLPGELCGLRHD